MSRTLVSVATTLVVVAALAPGAIGGVAADEVTLTVNVVDSNGNSVGSGMEVVATWDDGNEQQTRTTAPNGQVLFGIPDGVDVEIQVQDSQYIRNVPYEVQNVTDQTVEVPVSVSGTATIVVENSNGQPVPNAEAVVFQDGVTVDRQSTGQDGTITTASLEQSSYGLWVRKSGFITNRTSLTIDSESVTKNVSLERGSVNVQFQVTDDHFSPPRPIENATVNIQNGASLPTLSNGDATTSLSVNRDYRVTVSKDGYDSVTETLSVDEDPASLNISIRRTNGINVRAANDRVVVNESTQVTVTDEYDEPVSGATVSVGGSSVGQTNENGQVNVPINSAGDVSIDVESGSLSSSVTVEGIQESNPTATPTETPTPTETATETETSTETPSENGPGFGITVALVALAVALLARRR